MELPALLARFKPAPPIAVALSAGADSTALAAAASLAWPGAVQAIHVHHGLQPAADQFESHARQLCQQLGMPLWAVRIDARNEPGESPEDAARNARYLALAQAAQSHGLQTVLLGHHADDQVETMLLALSRGAGLPGLAAMPARFERHGVSFARPFLAVPGAALREWLASQRLGFVEDPSNLDTAFTRNRIRHELLPALGRAFPQFRETFARSASHAAQAQALLAEVACEDLQATGSPPAIDRLRRLSRQRQGNLLRHWLRDVHRTSASAAQMAELLVQVEACTTRGHAIRIKVGQGIVTRSGDTLVYESAASGPKGRESA